VTRQARCRLGRRSVDGRCVVDVTRDAALGTRLQELVRPQLVAVRAVDATLCTEMGGVQLGRAHVPTECEPGPRRHVLRDIRGRKRRSLPLGDEHADGSSHAKNGDDGEQGDGLAFVQ
jgi:hypothetical protein